MTIRPDRLIQLLGPAVAVLWIAGSGSTQSPQSPDPLIPANATALVGTPRVRVDATQDEVRRRELTADEAAKSRFTIAIVDGRYYWGSPTGVPLTVGSAGGYTYLSSREPGRYVKFRRLNETLTYVEHIDMAPGTVTYWGELRIVLGK